MKKIVFLTIVFLFLYNGSKAQINMSSNGYVTIGSTTNALYPLDVRGKAQFICDRSYGYDVGLYINTYYDNVNIEPCRNNAGFLGIYKRWKGIWTTEIYTTYPVITSDARMKNNIKPFSNSLSKLTKLQGVQFDYKKEYFKQENENSSDTKKLNNQIGLIAQDVQKIFPEVVVYDSIHDIYGILYANLIPIIIEAIKEENFEIDELAKIVNASSGKFKSQKEPVYVNSAEDVVPYLAQNSPNPFNISTEISYFLSEKTQKAMLNIYDMNGLQLKSITIYQMGKGSVTIQASELNPGMYMYSLIADGKEIDTKRMILTQ